jgi:thiol-disulfide isomerase/thioredoxin
MQRRLGRNAYAIAVTAIMTLSLLAASVSAGDADDRELVPDWTLQGADGTPLNFYQHSADRPAVILFWATWCPYCRQLMPHLEKLRQEFAPAGVNFYALDIWEDGDPVAYMKENGYGFHLLLNGDEVAKTYGVKGTPGLFVVDANRAVLYVRKSGTSPTRVESDLRFVLGNAAQ